MKDGPCYCEACCMRALARQAVPLAGRPYPCEDCDGCGRCLECQGRGRAEGRPCPSCGATGKCGECEGTGTVFGG